jgi:tetratricopeptide (TPR) repeat protein
MRQWKRIRRLIPGFWGAIFLLSLTPLGVQSSEDTATGVALFERGQLAAAQQFFATFNSQYPTDPAGAYYLGRIAFENAQYAQAATWFERAVQLDNDNSDYHRWLGRTYGQQAQHAGGEAFFLARKVKTHLEKAVELNPDNIEARFDLLEYYLQAPAFLGGDAAKAKKQAAEIAKRNAAMGRKAWQRCRQQATLEEHSGPDPLVRERRK